jgi:hypothetical protein
MCSMSSPPHDQPEERDAVRLRGVGMISSYDLDKYHKIANCLIHEVGYAEPIPPEKPRLPAGEASPRGANNWEPRITFSLARSSNPARETCATFA